MSPRSTDYALLAQNVYRDTPVNKTVSLDGVVYRVIAAENNPITGFQAQAYEREDVTPNQVIVAFRGTEFDREPIHDGGVDAGMVLTGVNLQTGDALAFTKRVMEQTREASFDQGVAPPDITVTGHSLGGTLAEISAARYGLRGETFNAYGAAGLLQGVPAGGNQVIDHVRAGDLVSAASNHFGEVRIYASQQDIDTLSKAGYRDDSGILSPRNPIKATNFDAHAIDNFIPESKLLGQSIINPESQARYRAHEGMVDRYRNDVMDIRKGLSAAWEVPKEIGEGARALGREVADDLASAGRAIGHAADEVADAAKRAGQEIANDVQEVGHAIGSQAAGAWNTITHPGSWFRDNELPTRVDHPDHPAHVLFQQARAGVERLDAEHQRGFDESSTRLAASLTAAASREGLQRIDHVTLNDDASRTYAVQGELQSAFKRVAEVNTQQAVATTVEESSLHWQQAAQQKPSATHQQQAQQQQAVPVFPSAGP
ncbi:XVIPCD domain-containing protein [Luteibacter sp. Lutesp34]|uniref:XVIPCD domain-containing protein n=1 Tax=Luteibacter sp. Lutesp34 TaxID=3243030 RepID=UPI0039B623A3